MGHTVLVTPAALPREAQVDEVKDLVARGKEAGFLTSDDIGGALVAAELPPESMDAVLRLLADEGIEILETPEDDLDEEPTAKTSPGCKSAKA